MTQASKRYEVESYGSDGKILNKYKFEGSGGARQAQSKLDEIRRGGRRAKLKREVFKDGKWIEEGSIQ